MITVAEAEKIVLSHAASYGCETVPFTQSLGRVLAEDIAADRDMPPFDRATMDGIAISYSSFAAGRRSYRIGAILAAGDVPVVMDDGGNCVEIMTGAALPEDTDTVIRYEDLNISDGTANVLIDNIFKGQNVHLRGKDRKGGDIVVRKGRFIQPNLINTLASVGKGEIKVSRLPKVVFISSGDELVDVHEYPSPYQIRTSNGYTVQAILRQYDLEIERLHVPDDRTEIQKVLAQCLEHYDVIVLSGGISMGRFDFMPQALKDLAVEQLFYKVQQRPGKPFWFGKHTNGTLVFALPGNPASTFMCTYRYIVPWLKRSLGVADEPALFAVLDEDFVFTPPLQYFLQVKLSMNDKGQLLARPIAGNNSGDFANLADTDAFMELPLERNNFMKGEAYRIWPFRQMLF